MFKSKETINFKIKKIIIKKTINIHKNKNKKTIEKQQNNQHKQIN